MDVVRVVNPSGESLYHQLVSLYRVFIGKSPDSRVTFNLRYVNWVFPLLILPIASHIRDTGSSYDPPLNPNVSSYLRTIAFPNGVNSVSQIQRSRTYIPIGILERGNPQREKLETAFAEMVYKVLKPSAQVRDAIYYPLTELVDNIFEHSKADEGYVLAQYYPNKDFVDLCIVDRGRGIAASYKEERGLDFDDILAIKKAALEGLSTKSEKARGYGIRSSKKIICNGLGGEFVLISGEAAFYSSQEKECIYRLPDFYWKGVIVTYRIPRPEGPVDIYQYIE